MNIRALTFGCVIGLSLALVPSCGTPGGGTGGGSGSTGGGSGSTGGGSGSTGGGAGSTGGGAGATGGGVGATGGGAGSTGGGAGATGGGAGATGGGAGSTGGGTGVTSCSLSTLTCPNANEMCFPFTQQSTTGGCFAGECNVVTQDCAAPTDTCLFGTGDDGGFDRICVPAGTKAPGATCSAGNECARGQCVGGKCTNFCYENDDCSDGGSCSTVVSFQGAPHVALACLYTSACDPFVAGSCTQAGEACYVLQNSPGCLAAGTKTVGTACDGYANECVPGAVCLQVQSTRSCRALCNLDAGTPGCADGGACINQVTGTGFGFCN